jgi:hypothetical protein
MTLFFTLSLRERELAVPRLTDDAVFHPLPQGKGTGRAQAYR